MLGVLGVAQWGQSGQSRGAEVREAEGQRGHTGLVVKEGSGCLLG